MSEESDIDVSDEDYEITEENHARLIENVIGLDDKQHIKKATRTEPSTVVSELHLVNSLTGKQGRVDLNDLAKSLKRDKRFSKIGIQVETFHKSSKTLEKPLEKPEEERVNRIVGYENLKNELTQWDPIVTHNRAAINLSFPIVKDINLTNDKKITNRFRIKSDIQKEMESLQPKVEVYNVEEEQNKFPLTMEEIEERRKETAKLRAIQSYKAAKNKRENKIKSKKFHRIQRKERLKKEFKEFEELQKTNPEEALKKLEEIERARAEERVTLRHKSTGKWARNKQIRAKYDKESRQALAQQLQLSRELTQKVKSTVDNDSDDGEEEVNQIQINSRTNESNPWVNGKIKVSEEVGDFVSGYRKFWNEQNKNLKEAEGNKVELKENENENTKNLDTKVDKSFTENKDSNLKDTATKKNQSTANNCAIKKELKKISSKLKKDSKKVVSKKGKRKTKDDLSLKKLHNKAKTTTTVKKLPKHLSTSDWEISAMDTDTLIDNMTYIIQAKLEKSLEQKANKLRKQLGLISKNNSKSVKKNNNTKIKSKVTKDLLVLPSKIKHPTLNENMIEDTTRKSEKDILQGVSDTPENSLDAILSLGTKKEKEAPKNNSTQKDIDPNKFMNAKPAILNTGIPDLLGYDDNVEMENQENAIAEAFQDDEIITDFAKEKQAEIEKEKPKDIDLTLPGWGSWGGIGIKVSSRKRKRFILKFPKNIPRKDHKKGNLIIKDNKKSVKPHLVSELPFPFKSVKDFEASIRAPVGNTFVPETAFRKNILPAVMTKMGSIIEPIDNDILLKKKKK